MLGELLHDEEVLFSVWLTLKVAAVCLALHLITAVPLALWARSPKAPFRRTLNFVVTLPLVFPPIALGYLLLMALGRPGLGSRSAAVRGPADLFSGGGRAGGLHRGAASGHQTRPGGARQ